MEIPWEKILYIAACIIVPAIIERITKLTKPTWKPFGIPVGKYDGEIWDAIKGALKKKK